MITFGLTHTGHVRKRNEDRFFVKKMGHGYTLLMVADGLGGHSGGDIASKIVAHKMAELVVNHADIKRGLRDQVLASHEAIKKEGNKNEALEGMASTVTALLLSTGTAHWIHVGDSRLYLFRNKILTQVTIDQNMAQFMVDEGELSKEDAQSSKLRHVLEQCVGIDECIPISGCLKIQSGDMVMLCTDGLHGELKDDILSDLMSQPVDIEKKTASLLNAALEAGGRDNITIVLAEV